MSEIETIFFSSIEKEKTLIAYQSYLRTYGQRLTTINGNKNVINNFLEWTSREQVNYTAVSYTDLLSYINYHKLRGNKNNTINGKLHAVTHFYNYLIESGQTKINPCIELRLKGIITQQPHDLLEWDELEQLYKNYPSNKITGKRNKMILAFMIYQGLTSGDVAALEVKDVKLEEGKVYIPNQAKSNERLLPLEAVQTLQLQKYITQVRPVILMISGKESEKLFISSGSGHRISNSLVRMIGRAKKMNPKVKSVKQIRASVITYWLTKYPIRQVQYMSGHRFVSSTERYRTDLLGTLQEQIDEMHPLK